LEGHPAKGDYQETSRSVDNGGRLLLINKKSIKIKEKQIFGIGLFGIIGVMRRRGKEEFYGGE
jgi:hypothetical protein